MRIVRPGIAACAILVCVNTSAPLAPSPQAAQVAQTTPLILEKDEGERRAVRGWPGHPDPGETFILKVDPKNGGSSHLVFLTADIRRGGAIDAHRHPEADEILFLESGTARVHVGDITKTVHGGSTVFIPANTWISVDTAYRTYVVPIIRGSDLPKLPSSGSQSEKELRTVATQLLEGAISSGAGSSRYTFSKQTTRQNLYRVPLQ